MIGTDLFAFGCILGVPVAYFLLKKGKSKTFAPLFIFLSGIWATFPYLLTEVFNLPKIITDSPPFYIFFFYPYLRKLEIGTEGSYGIFVLFILYVCICAYYINYAKKVIRTKECLEKDAK